MAGNSSAQKRHRQDEVSRLRNRKIRSRIHTEKNKFLEAANLKDIEKAQSTFKEISKLIDSAAGKGVYHKNTADRKKSRLHKMLNKISVD